MGFYRGIEYINKYGSRYDDYGTVTIKDIFREVYKKGMIKRTDESDREIRLQEIYGVRKYMDLAVKIYTDYLRMIVDDVIDGDVVQMTDRKYPLACVGVLTRQESDRILEKDYLVPTNIDIRQFDYKIPRITLFFGEKSKYTDRVFHVPKYKYDLFHKNLNKGKKYIIFKSMLHGSKN